MDLRLCFNQGPKSLEERFELFDNSYFRESDGLVALLGLLRAHPDERVVYGLSSMDRLCLLSQDYWATPWWVMVLCHMGGFRVECMTPAALAPWRGASFSAQVRTPEDAVKVIVRSLDVCRGWDSSVGGVPGLIEILERELTCFFSSPASEKCRSMVERPKESTWVTWSPKGHGSKATVVIGGHEQSIVYIHDGGYTYGRWGIARPHDGQLIAAKDHGWYNSLEGAFCSSKFWTGEIPKERFKFRDVAAWRARPDLWREPTDDMLTERL